MRDLPSHLRGDSHPMCVLGAADDVERDEDARRALQGGEDAAPDTGGRRDGTHERFEAHLSSSAPSRGRRCRRPSGPWPRVQPCPAPCSADYSRRLPRTRGASSARPPRVPTGPDPSTRSSRLLGRPRRRTRLLGRVLEAPKDGGDSETADDPGGDVRDSFSATYLSHSHTASAGVLMRSGCVRRLDLKRAQTLRPRRGPVWLVAICLIRGFARPTGHSPRRG